MSLRLWTTLALLSEGNRPSKFYGCAGHNTRRHNEKNKQTGVSQKHLFGYLNTTSSCWHWESRTRKMNVTTDAIGKYTVEKLDILRKFWCRHLQTSWESMSTLGVDAGIDLDDPEKDSSGGLEFEVSSTKSQRGTETTTI